ncbi:superoxide dismutase family protein [Pseudonocardia acaciae]|uniref:superoxide dismutase family protein n=1 Tax=Pseudonocardia acaciae TaxID=551276 RepID=UPI00048D222B|nr:superoxide dismutase family protein [Pseudonocardia acaciae]
MRSLSPPLLVFAGALLAAGLAAGCATQAPSSQPSQPPTHQHSSATNPGQTAVGATFGTDDAASNYDKTLVPNGAKMVVAEYIYDGSTTVTLNVRGLVPNRAYGAHAHAMPCGPKGDDAGPHFQHETDPVKPSVDPNYANPRNEIWLDFTTDAQGNATAATTVPWVFSNARAASVVIHADSTQTGPGKAGTAGARAGCLSVGF